MTVDDKKRDKKNYSTILIEKQQKYNYYHPVELINVSLVKNYYLRIKVK